MTDYASDITVSGMSDGVQDVHLDTIEKQKTLELARLGGKLQEEAGMVDKCWRALPKDIIFSHILPKCDIDTRLAFKIPPSKMCSQRYKSSDFVETLRHRYAPDRIQQAMGVQYVLIPLHTIAGWYDNSDEESRHAMVNLGIFYDFAGYRRNKIYKDSIQITVICIDYRDVNKYPRSYGVDQLWL
jgi:hypothetical protein